MITDTGQSLSGAFALSLQLVLSSLQSSAVHQPGGGCGGRGPRQGTSPQTRYGSSTWSFCLGSKGSVHLGVLGMGPSGWPCAITVTVWHSVWTNLQAERHPRFLSAATLELKHLVQPVGLESVPGWAMAKEKQARYPRWHMAGIRRPWTYTLLCFCSRDLTQAFFLSDHSKNKRNGKAFSKISFSNDSPSATKSKQVACTWKV